jgi:hypothetical protein
MPPAKNLCKIDYFPCANGHIIDHSMNDLRFKLLKLRLLLIVAFLALVGLALRLHQWIR